MTPRTPRIYVVVALRFTRYRWGVFGFHRNGQHSGEGWYYETREEAEQKRKQLRGLKWPRDVAQRDMRS